VVVRNFRIATATKTKAMKFFLTDYEFNPTYTPYNKETGEGANITIQVRIEMQGSGDFSKYVDKDGKLKSDQLFKDVYSNKIELIKLDLNHKNQSHE
jgi:hypothetical protein